MSRKRKNTTGIPDDVIDSLARALLPAIQEFFSIEKNQKEYEEWLMANKMQNASKPNR